jgi:hypothetical protein
MGISKEPYRRRKKSRKGRLLTDEKGIPFSIVISGANTHNIKLLVATLDRAVIERQEDNGFGNLSVNYEKMDQSYLDLRMLVEAIIVLGKNEILFMDKLLIFKKSLRNYQSDILILR